MYNVKKHQKEYYQKHRDILLSRHKQWYQKNKEEVMLYHMICLLEKIEKLKRHYRRYCQKYKVDGIKYQREYFAGKKKKRKKQIKKFIKDNKEKFLNAVRKSGN